MKNYKSLKQLQAEGRQRMHEQLKKQARKSKVSKLTKPVRSVKSLQTLNQFWVASVNDPKNLAALISIRNSIQSPALAKFLDTLFSDKEIALAFIKVPASRKHHHNYVGGLLEHSIEVAETVDRQQFKSSDDRDIAVVAALLHDIGKVKTLQPSITTTMLGKMIDHDSLTLEICAAALKGLDRGWPDAAYLLRHVWSCASAGAKYGFERNSTIANYLQFADKLSVDNFNESFAFKRSNKTTGLAWDGAKYCCRPKPEEENMVRRRFYA